MNTFDKFFQWSKNEHMTAMDMLKALLVLIMMLIALAAAGICLVCSSPVILYEKITQSRSALSSVN